MPTVARLPDMGSRRAAAQLSSAILVALAVAGCASGRETSHTSGVVTGTVLSGPRCPGPEIASSPCPPGPVAGAAVVALRRGHVIGSTRTDVRGGPPGPAGRRLLDSSNQHRWIPLDRDPRRDRHGVAPSGRKAPVGYRHPLTATKGPRRSVVDRCSADVVIGAEQGFGQHRAYMSAAEAIDDPLALTLPFDQSGEPKLGQVLAGHRRPAARDSGETGHIQLGVAQCPQHLHARGIREQ